MATFAKHTFPGLPNPVYLPDSIEVQIKIIPNGTPGWTSGQKLPVKNFTSTTWHDTGNLVSSASSEYKWAATGGRAGINSPGSYNGIIGKNLLIVAQRFDELVGHAANHQGNITSYAFEQSELGTDAKFNASRETGMWVHAGVLQAMGRTALTSMYQHNYWSGKNCPGQIRKRSLWSATEQGVDDRIAQIVAFLANEPGDGPKPPVYPAPARIPALDAVSSADVVAPSYVIIPHVDIVAFFVGDRYEAIRDTPPRQYAYKDSPVLGPNVKQGESFNVDFVFESDKGMWAYTPYGARFLLDDLKRVSDAKGEEAA
jgi:hypothetical protein